MEVAFGCCLTGGSLMPQAGGTLEGAGLPVSVRNGVRSVLDKSFDFAEWTVVGLMSLSAEQFAELSRLLREAGLIIPAFNSFLPGDVRLCGPSVDWTALEQYVAQGMERVAALGGRIVVFGSGKARRLPDGFSYEEGMGQIKRFLRLCEAYAAKYGVMVAIEPLNKKETNVIHTVKEALAITADLGLPHIAVLADAYHMQLEGEPFTHVREAMQAGKLIHVHIAEADRSFPVGASDGIAFSVLFRELLASGYSGAISFECSSGHERSAESLAYIRELWNEARANQQEGV